jgi:hypothetical protein
MADFEQSRLSTRQTASLAAETHASLSVRIWKQAEPSGPSGRPLDPARTLILDLISASKGALSQPDAPVISASFPAVAPAVLAARRVQWALQGLAQSDPASDLATAILVCAADDLADSAILKSAQAALNLSPPGQILLTPNAAEALKDIPSLPLQSIPESAMQELVWRAAAVEPSRSLDEEAIEALIKQHGLESEVPQLPPPQEPEKPLPALTREVKAVGVFPPPPVWEQPEPEAPSAPRGLNPRLLYAGGGGLLALLAIVGYFALSHGTKNPAPQPSVPTTAVEQASPATQTSQTATKTPKTKPSATPNQPTPLAADQNPSAPIPKDTPQSNSATTTPDAPPVQVPQPKEKSGGCSLEQSEIPKLLAQADSNRAAGRYEDALRQYKRVLDCGENARARNGQEITHLAMQH